MIEVTDDARLVSSFVVGPGKHGVIPVLLGEVGRNWSRQVNEHDSQTHRL